MKEVGFGIIGLGMIANIHMSAIEAIEGARVAAVTDIIEERAKSEGELRNVSWYTSYKDLLKNSEVDVVCVCTPSGMREQIVIDAAAAGKHIISEKPLDITLDRVDRMIEACNNANVKLCAIFQSRYFEGVKALKKVVDSGEIGKLIMGDAYIKWHRPQSYYDTVGWRGTWALDGGGALMNQGIHYIDLLQWIMGPVESVFAFTDTLIHQRIEVEDTAVACLKFKNGAMGVIQACTSAHTGMPARLEIRGENGNVIIEDGFIKYWNVGDKIINSEEKSSGSGASDPSAIGFLGHQLQIADMVDAIRNDRPPIIDGKEARNAIELIAAIYKSSRTGKVVSLPLE